MSQSILRRQLEVSAKEALCCGEMERAEHLYASLIRLERKHISRVLESSLILLANNSCTIHDEGYIPRNYLITAIVSTYKASRFMEGRIRNLLDQSVAEQLEILVIDSASPENEVDFVRTFQQQYSNIRYFRTERRESVYQAWNRGVSAARGRYLTNANTDDRLRSDALEQMVAVLEQGADVVFADSLFTRVENETFLENSAYNSSQRPTFHRNALLESCITGSHPVWRKSLHDDIGYFDTAYSSAGDYDFFVRASRTAKFVHVPETLGLVWTSPQTFSGKGFLPNMEFYAVRERYKDFLLPTGNDLRATPEHVQVLMELQILAKEGTTESIDELIQDNPSLCYEFGVSREQQHDITNAWRYLQRAYYLVPENLIYRNAMERIFKASLRSSIMDLAACNDFPRSSDMLMTTALASQLLGYPGIAAWLYFAVIEHDPENTTSIAALDKIVKEMLLGGF